MTLVPRGSAVPKRFLALCVLACADHASALLLEPQVGPVRVLVFGDSWASNGPGGAMLQSMFARNGVPATVKTTGVAGTRACQWAAKPANLFRAAQQLFPVDPDFVWYQLGANDLWDVPYRDCLRHARSFDDVDACLEASTAKINRCSDTLLDYFWENYPRTEVVQCGYDLKCEHRECVSPFFQQTYCRPHHYNGTCLREIQQHWQAMLLRQDSRWHKDPRFTGINILGTLQYASGMEGAWPGHPNLTRGSPCRFIDGCTHPRVRSKGANAIGDAFWDLYFKGRVAPSTRPRETSSIIRAGGDDDDEPPQRNTEADVAVCIWNWVPDFSNWTDPPDCGQIGDAAKEDAAAIARQVEDAMEMYW